MTAGYPHRHLLGIEPLEPSHIQAVLDTAEALREVLDRPIKKVPALRGKTVVNLFYEPSTRTRASFEIAEKVLSADSLSIATSTSSAQITDLYEASDLVGLQVVAVVNVPPRRVAGLDSQVLVLAVENGKGESVLLIPERPVPDGGRVS